MKIAVLTDPESATGYRLGGVEVATATDRDEACRQLSRMVRGDAYALIAVSEGLIADPAQAVRREMHGRVLPVLLSVPTFRRAAAGDSEDAEEYVRRMIRETMGYEIKL